MRQLFPLTDHADVDPNDVYADLRLPDGVNGRPYVILNMVSTVDGKTTLGTSAAGIGSPTDWHLMRQLRSGIDAYMIGAATLRTDTVDPRVDAPRVKRRVAAGLPPQPVAVTVSASLDVSPTHRFLVSGPPRTVILTTSDADDDRRRRLAPYARIVNLGTGTIDLDAGMRLLHDEYGVRKLLCEGGATLNQHLLNAGLVDEIFWTIAPKVAGGTSGSLIEDAGPAQRTRARLELISVYEEHGELFTRYRLRRGPDGAYLT